MWWHESGRRGSNIYISKSFTASSLTDVIVEASEDGSEELSLGMWMDKGNETARVLAGFDERGERITGAVPRICELLRFG